MAVVFTLGFSAVGATGQGSSANLGTFMAGMLLVGMAAFAPLATYSFVHWAGDQGHAATQALQQGNAGVHAGKEQLERLQGWGAQHFSGSDDEEPTPAVGSDHGVNDDSRDNSVTEGTATAANSQESAVGRTAAAPGEGPSSQPASGGSNSGSTSIAVATSAVSVDGQPAGNPEAGTGKPNDEGE
jgi:hypothetical protein